MSDFMGGLSRLTEFPVRLSEHSYSGRWSGRLAALPALWYGQAA
jgi:hypothetical protein